MSPLPCTHVKESVRPRPEASSTCFWCKLPLPTPAYSLIRLTGSRRMLPRARRASESWERLRGQAIPCEMFILVEGTSDKTPKLGNGVSCSQEGQKCSRRVVRRLRVEGGWGWPHSRGVEEGRALSAWYLGDSRHQTLQGREQSREI